MRWFVDDSGLCWRGDSPRDTPASLVARWSDAPALTWLLPEARPLEAAAFADSISELFNPLVGLLPGVVDPMLPTPPR